MSVFVPAVSPMSDTLPACPKCGSTNLVSRYCGLGKTCRDCRHEWDLGVIFGDWLELVTLRQRITTLEAALRPVLEHIEELRDAWMRGAIAECDGQGGTRSTRNVKVEVMLRAALE